MVDVGAKKITKRVAIAEGEVVMHPGTLARVTSDDFSRERKGNVIAVARIAGIMAAKRTSELIPLCHPLQITKATVDLVLQDKPVGISVRAEVKIGGQTGVEMEALTAVSIACLTIYDMLKAADKGMMIGPIRLLEKSGGKSGTFKATE